ncbi:MAG: helix-turn-helix domain-containing protein [Mycobacteriales bacterium]
MIELAFDAADVARVRMAVSALGEVVWSTVALRKPGRAWLHRPWRDRVVEGLAGEDFGLLFAMTAGRTYLPDFLVPVPAGPRPTLAEELEALVATPPGRAVTEAGRIHPGRPLPPELAAFAADPVAGLHRLAGQLRRYFEVALATHWPRLRAVAEADIAHRTALAGAEGALSLLAGLHPEVHWDGARLRLAVGRVDFTALGDDPLVLTPCAFAWPATQAANVTAGGWHLLYPPRGVGQLWEPGHPTPPAPLTRLLGATRAAVLAYLDTPRDTTEVARALGIATATASHHLTTLRAAGLAVTTPDGRRLRYLRTTLADHLLTATGQP